MEKRTRKGRGRPRKVIPSAEVVRKVQVSPDPGNRDGETIEAGTGTPTLDAGESERVSRPRRIIVDGRICKSFKEAMLYI